MCSPSPRFHTFAASAVLGCLALAVASGAGAQEQPVEPAERERSGAARPEEAVESQQGIEVIHIRARESGAIDVEVPASLTQFDAATIQALGAEDISDLSRVTPNVSIVQPGATQATFFIRGIGLSDFSSNAAGAVTIFQDDVAVNAPAIQTPQLFDIENVDIVRGPQGSGHFRNASAGAIRVSSRRPSGNYSANLRSTLGRYQADSGQGARHALIQDYEGAIEFPIVEQLLSSRFSFRLRDADPYKINGCGEKPPISERLTRADAADSGIINDKAIVDFINQCGEEGRTYIISPPSANNERSQLPAGLPRRVGDAHNWAARGIFRLTPPDSEWDVELNGHGSRLDQQATLGQAIGTGTFSPPLPISPVGGPTYGGQTNSLGAILYMEPDITEEYAGLDGRSGLCQDRLGTGFCTNLAAQHQLAKNLARKRPLDIRPYRGDFDLVGQTTRDAWGSVLSATGKLADLDLTAIASVDGYRREADEDLDFTPDELIFERSKDRAWQTYEEVSLSGPLDPLPVDWELGGYYLIEELNARVFDRILDNTFRVRRIYEQKIQSGAVWGEFAWDFLDDFTLAGGVRWNYEKKHLDYLREFNEDPLGTVESQSWSVPTGQLILTWHVNDRINLYTRYTRGWKAGHYNSIASDRVDALLADPETNDAWEAGARGVAWGGRLSASGAFYYYHYTDYQVFVFSAVPANPPALSIVNAHEAELYGIEVEGRARPLQGLWGRFLDGLELSANASWAQGKYIDFQNEQSFRFMGGFSTVTFDYSGNDLANAPRYKFSGTVEWTLDLGRFGALIPRYDVSWTDDQFFDPTQGRGETRRGALPLPKLAVAQPALWLHHVRLAYRTPSQNVEIAGWARNVTDEVYKTYVFDASRFGGEALHFVGEPRTVGADLTITF